MAARLRAAREAVDTRGPHPDTTAAQRLERRTREPVAGSPSAAVAALFYAQTAPAVAETGADTSSRSDASTARASGPLGSGGATFPQEGAKPKSHKPFSPLPSVGGLSAVPRRWLLAYKIHRLLRADLAPGERGPATCGCGMPAVDATTVNAHLRYDRHGDGTLTPRAGVSGVHRCKSPWLCATCSTAAAAERAARVEAVAEATYARGGTVALVVLTASHKRDTSLADGMALVAKASTRARAERAWARTVEACRVLGAVVGQETTCSTRNGWHYHQHIALPIDGPTEAEVLTAIARAGDRVGPVTGGETAWNVEARAQEAADTLAALYKRRIRAAGGTVSDRHGTYVRIASDPQDASLYTAKGSSAWEVAGGHKTVTRSATSLTPWDLAELAYGGDAWARQRWDEYAATMPGTRSCVVSAALQKRLDIDLSKPAPTADEQATHEQDGVIGRLEALIWKILRRRGLVGAFFALIEETADAHGEAEAWTRALAWAVEQTAEDVRREDERRDLRLLPERERYVVDDETGVARVMTPEEQHAAVEARRAEVRAMGDLRRADPPLPTRPARTPEQVAAEAEGTHRAAVHRAAVEALRLAGPIGVARAVATVAATSGLPRDEIGEAAVRLARSPVLASLVPHVARMERESLPIAA